MPVSVVLCDCCEVDTGFISFMQRFLVCILGGSSSGSRLATISATSPQLPLPFGTPPEVIANFLKIYGSIVSIRLHNKRESGYASNSPAFNITVG